MTKSTKPNKRRESGTLTKLQSALGLSKRRVSSLLAAGCPADPVAAVAWRQERENSDTAAALRKERIGLVRAQRERVEVENARVRGELIPRDEAKQSDHQLAAALQGFLRALEVEIPQLCLGLPLDRSRPLVRARIREIQKQLADEKSAFWADHPVIEGK